MITVTTTAIVQEVFTGPRLTDISVEAKESHLSGEIVAGPRFTDVELVRL